MCDVVNTKDLNNNLVQLPLGDLAQTINYSGSNISSIAVVYNSVTYTQTWTYTNGLVSGISKWLAS